MNGLRDLQQRFAAYLLGAEDSIVPASVVGDDKADARERMDLYAGAYRARLVDSLGVDYPGLWSMLGDEQFYALCLDYIRQHPSRHTSIRWFGDRLPAFLGKTSPYDAYPQVAEMAAFEWAQGLVFDAADVTAIGSRVAARGMARHASCSCSGWTCHGIFPCCGLPLTSRKIPCRIWRSRPFPWAGCCGGRIWCPAGAAWMWTRPGPSIVLRKACALARSAKACWNGWMN